MFRPLPTTWWHRSNGADRRWSRRHVVRTRSCCFLLFSDRLFVRIGDLVQIVVDGESAHLKGRCRLVRGALEHEESAVRQFADNLDLVLLAHQLNGDAGYRGRLLDQVLSKLVHVGGEDLL